MDIPRQGSIADSCFMIWNRELLESGKRLSLRVNGVEVPAVTAYDLDKGWVDAHAIGPNGERESKDGRVVCWRITGPEVTAQIVAK